MKKVTLTIGAPGSGKSTWAIEEARKKGVVRICRDDIRAMMGDYWVPEREGLVLRVMRTMLLDVLRDPYTYQVIIDETNLNPTVRLSWLAWILDIDPEVDVEYKVFGADLSELLNRNETRTDHHLPEEVLRNFYEKTQNAENTGTALEKELKEYFRKEQDYRLETPKRKEMYMSMLNCSRF